MAQAQPNPNPQPSTSGPPPAVPHPPVPGGAATDIWLTSFDYLDPAWNTKTHFLRGDTARSKIDDEMLVTLGLTDPTQVTTATSVRAKRNMAPLTGWQKWISDDRLERSGQALLQQLKAQAPAHIYVVPEIIYCLTPNKGTQMKYDFSVSI